MSILYPLLPAIEAAQATNRSNTWLWIILFLIVVIVVWWLLSRATPHSGEGIEAHEEHGHEAHAEEEPAAPMATKGAAKKPAAVPAPEVAAKPDDLAILEGIGPKVKSLLAGAGITTFAQLAASELDTLNQILDSNKLQFLDPTTWPEQASLAAEGKMDELQELMDNLKGGRKVE